MATVAVSAPPRLPEGSPEGYLVALMWPNGVECPKCGPGEPAVGSKGRAWRCRSCRGDFTATSGTAMHGSRIGAAKWAAARSSDIRPPALARELGVSASAARRMSAALEATGESPGENRLVASECVTAMAYLPPQPERVDRSCPEQVPPKFWSLFWSGSSAKDPRLPEDAFFVAGTLLDDPDPVAQTWAMRCLPTEALRRCRAMRGYDAGEIAVRIDMTWVDDIR